MCAIGFCICDTSFQHRHVTSGPSSSVYPCPFFCGFLNIVAKNMWYRMNSHNHGPYMGYPQIAHFPIFPYQKNGYLGVSHAIPFKPEGLPETSQLGFESPMPRG